MTELNLTSTYIPEDPVAPGSNGGAVSVANDMVSQGRGISFENAFSFAPSTTPGIDFTGYLGRFSGGGGGDDSRAVPMSEVPPGTSGGWKSKLGGWGRDFLDSLVNPDLWNAVGNAISARSRYKNLPPDALPAQGTTSILGGASAMPATYPFEPMPAGTTRAIPVGLTNDSGVVTNAMSPSAAPASGSGSGLLVIGLGIALLVLLLRK